MTIKEVEVRLEEIKKWDGDAENQHILEDKLYHDVLETIAYSMSQDSYTVLAQLALKTKDIKFRRHCA